MITKTVSALLALGIVAFPLVANAAPRVVEGRNATYASQAAQNGAEAILLQSQGNARSSR